MVKQLIGKNAAANAERARVSHWLTVVGALLAVTLALSPTVVLLWSKWSEGYTYSHGVLILPLVMWLVFRQRQAIAATEQLPVIPAFVVLAGLLFFWTWTFAASIAIGAELLWPLIMICTVVAVSGWRAAMCILVPILILYSAIPVWDAINPILQSMTTAAVSVILKVVGVPAFIDGNFVQIPAGVFEIAGGCSGLHFFIVALTLAAVYGHLYYGRFSDLVLLLAISGAMSIAMNWFRVATIIIAGHLTEMQSYLVQVDHYTFGWVLFVVMLVPFYLIARRLERGSKSETPSFSLPKEKKGFRAAPAGTALLLLMLPMLVWVRLVVNSPAVINIQLPAVDGWQSVSVEKLRWRPEFADPDGEAHARYVFRDGRQIDVYANWYETQSQERELIGYYTSLAGKDARVSYDKPIAGVGIANAGESLEIHEIMADYQTGERRLIWYHFLIDGESRPMGLTAQLRLGLLAMTGNERSGAIAVSTICEGHDCNDARVLFAENFPAINKALTDTLLALAKQ